MIKRNCDLCPKDNPSPAIVDTKTKMGPWAYLCPACNDLFGCKIDSLTNVLADI